MSIGISLALTPSLAFSVRHGPWLRPWRWGVEVTPMNAAPGSPRVFRQYWRWGLLVVSWGPPARRRFNVVLREDRALSDDEVSAVVDEYEKASR